MNQENFNPNRKAPFFFREQYANLIVKGNFMTLAAKPVLVEEGEWLAHQGTTYVDFRGFSLTLSSRGAEPFA